MQTDFVIMQNSQEMLSESIKCEEGNQKAVKPSEVTEGEDLSFFSAFIEIADNRNMPLPCVFTSFPRSCVEMRKQVCVSTTHLIPLQSGTLNEAAGKYNLIDLDIILQQMGKGAVKDSVFLMPNSDISNSFEPDGSNKRSDQAIEITAIIGKEDKLIKTGNPLQIVEEIQVKDLKLESRAANSEATPDKDLKLESRAANSGTIPDKDLKLESRAANSEATPEKAMNKGDAGKNDFLQKAGFTDRTADDPAGDINRDVACRLSNPEMKRYHQNIKAGVAKEQSSNTDLASGRDIKLEADNGKDPFLFSSARSSDNLSEANVNLKETQLSQKPFQAEIISQIVKKAVLKIKNGQNEIKIDIKPESLGHIRMQISTENHYVRAMISAENNLVKQIIENNIHLLRAELLNHGLEIDKFEVSLGQDSGQNSSGNQKTEFTGIEQETDSVEETEDILPVGTDGSISYPGQSDGGQQVDLFA